MQPNDFIEANRTFDEISTRIFAEIGLKDKAVMQLGCNSVS